jgi:hypothetical protein
VAQRKNYSFEKNQRAKAKAAKREAKREQKAAERAEKRQNELGEANEPDADTGEATD